jgi:hypothetical protein
MAKILYIISRKLVNWFRNPNGELNEMAISKVCRISSIKKSK